MILRKTYRLFEEDEREFIYEEVQNEMGQIVSFIDIQADNTCKGTKEYNNEHKIVKEAEFIGDSESSRIEYSYDTNGKILSLKQFVADEVITETVYDYSDNKVTEKSFQFGEEKARIIEYKEENKYIKEYYDGDALKEVFITVHDPASSLVTIELRDNNNQLIETETREFDEDKNLISRKETSNDGQLYALSEFKYENGKVIFEKHEDYDGGLHNEITYEYDANNNLISQEKRTPSDRVLGYQKREFDDQSRLIWEHGFSLGPSNPVIGANSQGQIYTFEHEYSLQIENQ